MAGVVAHNHTGLLARLELPKYRLQSAVDPLAVLTDRPSPAFLEAWAESPWDCSIPANEVLENGEPCTSRQMNEYRHAAASYPSASETSSRPDYRCQPGHLAHVLPFARAKSRLTCP